MDAWRFLRLGGLALKLCLRHRVAITYEAEVGEKDQRNGQPENLCELSVP